MFFDSFLEDLPGIPKFTTKNILDVNVLSGIEKHRLVYAPNEAMALLHTRFRKYLYTLPAPGIAPGGMILGRYMRSRTNSLRNIYRHERNRNFYIVDLKEAFPSVDIRRLAEILCGIDDSLKPEETLKFLEEYCSVCGVAGLLTGSPSSSALFEIYVGTTVDAQLKEDLRRWKVTCSRITDDMTFSSGKVIGKRKRKRIRTVISEAGLSINHEKTKVLDSSKAPIFINGIGIKWHRSSRCNTFFIPRGYLRKLSGLINEVRQGSCPISVLHGHMGPLISLHRKGGPCGQAEYRVMADYRALVEQNKLLKEN